MTLSEKVKTLLGKKYEILDHGFIILVDVMGDDSAIAQSARVSYGKGTKTISEDRGLIRYLMRHRHSTPFEMVEFKFHVKLPIFVARQWIRHRTANVNEYSARYSVLDKEFYIPETEILAAQSESNKQGREKILSEKESADIRVKIDEHSDVSYNLYEYLLNEEEQNDPNRSRLTRELSRIVLPTNVYTQWYWKIDLHNLFHFLSLRLDVHAQHEIRVYAKVMGDIVKEAVPIAYEAFENYQLNAMQLSSLDIAAIGVLFQSVDIFNPAVIEEACSAAGMTNKREKKEFMEKLKQLRGAIE